MMIDSKLPIIGSGYDHAGRYATHALPHQEPPHSSAFVGARRVKTFHRENNQLRNRETTRSPFEALVPIQVTSNDVVEVTGQVIILSARG